MSGPRHNAAVLAFLAGFYVAALVGCGFANWRVLQKTVPATASEPPKQQVEGQRVAAAYIAQRTAPPVLDPPKAIEDVHEVATSLSASLGEPAKPVETKDKDAVIDALRVGLRSKEEQLAKWREFGRKYAGTPLEDTGVNLAGPAGIVGLVLVIAACIAFPPIGYALLRLLPLLWGFFKRTTEAIGDFARQNPEEGKVLAAELGDKLDKVHKKLVAKRAAKVAIPKSITNAPFPA